MLSIFKILLLWIFGILLVPYNPFTFIQLGFLLALASSLFLYCYFNFSFESKTLQNIVLVLFLVGVVSFLDKAQNLTTNESLKTDTEYTVLVKVKERYKQTNFLNKYIVEVQALYDDSILYVNQDFLFYQKSDSDLKQYFPGDRFQAKVYCAHLKEAKHDDLFNSKRFWDLNGIYAILWLQNEQTLNLKPSSTVYYRIRRLQANWIELIQQQSISKESQEILTALLLGNKRGVSKDISAQFSRLGLVHTLALSGLHISLLYGVCAFLLSIILKYRPSIQSILLILVILSHAVLTGLSPSVMRASLMFLLYAISLMFNRKTTVFNVVFLSAFILLVFQPNLIYSIGFQLSYMAVIGIVYFYSKFKKYIEHRSTIVQFFLGLALVSLAAQVSTGFLSVYYFKSFPLSFLWSNLIVLPLITVLVYQGLLYLFLVLTSCNFTFFDVLIDQTVSLVLYVIKLLEAHSFAPINIYLSLEYVFFLYGLLVLVCFVFLEKHFKYLKLLYCYSLFLTVYIMIYSKPNRLELFVNASAQGYVISVTANMEQVLISNNFKASAYLLGDYSLANGIVCKDSLAENSIYENEFCFVSKNLIQIFKEKLVLVSDGKLNYQFRLPADLVFLKSYREDLKGIKAMFSTKVLLLHAKISKTNRLKLKSECQELKIPVIDLSSEVYVRRYEL